ncbi:MULTISPECIES: glycosyltransferase [unclassified Bacteroides]|uniref:glycosyltransferase n=1 Tax=unclassified Bacteroides TaxID=2646097 RepID=UPI0004E15A15|nr:MULTISPECIES: glycosyltransferase [unclassified Bacteroides]
MLFLHYIITRFNLRLFPKGTNGKSLNNIDEDYLSKRLDLFERYCYPSIRKQTNQNFKWFLLMDIDTPSAIKNRIQVLGNNYENLKILYLNSEEYCNRENWENEEIQYYNKYANLVNLPDYSKILYGTKIQCFVMPKFINEMIARNSEDTADYYITTRIDNDDAFHCDMVETVQQQFLKDRKCCMYNFLYGYQYNVKDNIVQKYYYRNNHFSSLVEKNDGTLKTVYYWDHRYVKKFIPVIDIKTKPLWVELLHGNNVANAFVVSHRNRLLSAAFSFSPENFGYVASEMNPSFLCAVKFLIKPFNLRAYLRSIKKRLLSQED